MQAGGVLEMGLEDGGLVSGAGGEATLSAPHPFKVTHPCPLIPLPSSLYPHPIKVRADVGLACIAPRIYCSSHLYLLPSHLYHPCQFGLVMALRLVGWALIALAKTRLRGS